MNWIEKFGRAAIAVSGRFITRGSARLYACATNTQAKKVYDEWVNQGGSSRYFPEIEDRRLVYRDAIYLVE